MKNIIQKTLFLALLFILPVQTQAAKMALSPSSGTFNTGCQTALNIIVNTEGADSMAADAFLRYNPNEIEIVDQMSGVSGVQLRPGSVYESYPGNIVSNGVIRMTAFNRQGYYNGRGVMGSLIFKSKPGVQSTTISFDYSAGQTRDSNVADLESNDLLNGAYGGTYTFKTGACGGDSSPPKIEIPKPVADDMNAPLDSNITFTISDNQVGVDLDTLKIQVNDITYTINGEHKFTSDGNPNRYKITINPTKDFLDKSLVVIKINVQDLQGNAMPEKIYGFNELLPSTIIELRPAADQPCPECESCPESLKCAAPEAVIGTTGWWPWWFVLLCSLILNWYFLQRLDERKKVKSESVKKQIRKRKK